MSDHPATRYPHAGGWIPRARSRVAEIQLDGESLLYEDRLGVLHELNPVAALVWTEYDGRRTLDQIAGELAATFDAEPDTIRRDLVALTTDLVERGVLELVEDDGDGRSPSHDEPAPPRSADGHRLLPDPPGG